LKIHVAIVSDQTLANLIPALMDRPDKVYLVCSSTMAERGLGRRLARLLGRETIDWEVVENAPDAGMRAIHEFALDLAARIDQEHPGAEIVFNVTGGNKLMAMGFVEVFRGIAERIIYTDTAHQRIEILPNAQGAVPDPVPMHDVLDVPQYLAAQGFMYANAVSDDIDWRERAVARKAASKYLGRNAAELQSLIGALNALADQALAGGETLIAPKQSLTAVPRGNWKQALEHLVKYRVLVWQPESRDIEFPDAELARFLHGGWLEEYAWHIIKDERISDVRLGVRGRWEVGAQNENEFDVLATHRNQLLFMECKTLRHREENDNHLAYKVDSLGQDVRGLFGETWLLTAREPSTVLHERARQARITLLGPAELSNLRDRVRAWMRVAP
jgi:hypothetical protein